MTPSPLVAGIELGGTKSIAVLARGRDIIDQARFATGTPDDTIGQLAGQLAAWQKNHAFEAIGIASFGPLARTMAGGGFSGIGATPKPDWSHTPLVAPFADMVDGAIILDTDVAGAALAEWRWGSFAGTPSLLYLTIGTGIGGTLVVDGRIVAGFTHAEMGHIRIRRAPGDEFAGICPFHGDCLEGLASGSAITARAGRSAADLEPEHPAMAAASESLAELLATLILTSAPHHILLGGGVGTSKSFPVSRVREAILQKLGGYVEGMDAGSIKRMIVRASLGDSAGPLGSIMLAEQALLVGPYGD